MTARFDPGSAVATAVQLELPLQPWAPHPVAPPPQPAGDTRHLRGKTAYLSGLAAEDAVERLYAATGNRILARRWRGSRAEIDLILKDGDVVVFVEVKKSRSFEAALVSLGRAQRCRIMQAAAEYLGGTPSGQLTETRFDLAMVNDIGAVQILENAFSEGE